MNEIANDLRQRAQDYREPDSIGPVLTEAADEIERLQGIVDRLQAIEKASVAFGSVDIELDDACDADIDPSPELDLIDRHTNAYLALKRLCRDAAEKARQSNG